MGGVPPQKLLSAGWLSERTQVEGAVSVPLPAAALQILPTQLTGVGPQPVEGVQL